MEKAERLEEAGAGLQVSPNASRILVDLGLKPRLAGRAVTPESINIMSAAGRRRDRPPAARRGRLVSRRRALLGDPPRRFAGRPPAAVNDHPTSICGLGCQFEDVTKHAGADGGAAPRQRAAERNGGGADRGRRHLVFVRNHLFPEVQPQFSGLIAWRARSMRTAAARANIPRRGCSSGWVRTRISSPIRSPAAVRFNVVAVVRAPGTGGLECSR